MRAQELKVKKLEMAKLRIQLQQAENRNIMLKREAEERERKANEAAEFEAMKLRVRQLELLVAENAATNPAKVWPRLWPGSLMSLPRQNDPDRLHSLRCAPRLVHLWVSSCGLSVHSGGITHTPAFFTLGNG
jgi:hypothetical protein